MRSWQTTPAEEAQDWPCDAQLPDATHAYFRAVDVAAPAAVTFRWVCQMRAAPYSYDWIDNLGRRSPRTLTPGLDELAHGQRVAGIFRLAAWVPDESLTIVTSACAATYLVRPVGEERSRLLGKLLLRAPGPAPVRAAIGWGFGWGDLVMMRRQLLNLAGLAEGSRS